MPLVHPRYRKNRAMPASLGLKHPPCRNWQPAVSGLSVFGPQTAACPAVHSLGTSKADEPQIWNSACRDHITTKLPPPHCLVHSGLREMRKLALSIHLHPAGWMQIAFSHWGQRMSVGGMEWLAGGVADCGSRVGDRTPQELFPPPGSVSSSAPMLLWAPACSSPSSSSWHPSSRFYRLWNSRSVFLFTLGGAGSTMVDQK